MSTFEPILPKPFADNWRDAYRSTDKDIPRISSYQAPGGEPVQFKYVSFRFTGGQSVDKAEYPYFGFWSNNPLNEKPHDITLAGELLGDEYIKARNALIEALRVKTDDDNCGYLEMPLWGRFPVVVETYDFDDKATENGKVNFSITFTRAGLSVTKRLEVNSLLVQVGDIASKTETLQKTAVASFEEALTKTKDLDTLASGLGQCVSALQSIVGRVQGVKSVLNDITNKCNSITHLIAQGVRAPAELAQAFMNACASIVTGVLEMKNAIDDTVSYFSTKDNTKNTLMQFSTANTFHVSGDAITEAQQVTKEAVENLFRTASFSAMAELFTGINSADTDGQVDSSITREKQTELWALFERLEETLNLENPDVYAAVEDVRITASQTLLAQNASVELSRELSACVPVLALSQYLGCSEQRIRELNRFADSFLITGTVVYV